MAKKRCNVCIGSGTVMGGGMIMVDCDNCDGTGKITVLEDIMQKDSTEYKSALDNIKKLDDKMSDLDAQKLLDDELDKIKNDNVTTLKRAKNQDGNKKN